MNPWATFFIGFVIGAIAMRRHMLRHIRREVLARIREYEAGLLAQLRRTVYDRKAERAS